MQLRILILLFIAGLVTSVWAQDDDREDNGFIIRLLEDQLSTESRKIRLTGVEGLLAAQATVKTITISDPDGIWLQIDDALIDWNRSALLRGRVDVKTLSAGKITISRQPIPEPGLQDPGTTEIAVPDLPVSVELETLSIDSIVLGEALLGFEAELQAAGALSLGSGSIDTTFELARLDGPGGEFSLALAVDADAETVALDLQANEPQGGVVAGLLSLEGAPPLEASVQANGPFSDLTAEIDFKADGSDLLDGRIVLNEVDGAQGYSVDITGRLQPLLPAELHTFFAEESTIQMRGREIPGDGRSLDLLSIDSGGLQVDGTLRTAEDGFPRAFELTARMSSPDGTPLLLPGGQSTVSDGQLQVSYGGTDRWLGFLQVRDLTSGALTLGNVNAQLGGRIFNAETPETRRITTTVDGTVTDISSTDPALLQALGDRITLLLNLDWAAGAPFGINTARVTSKGVVADIDGIVGSDGFEGAALLRIEDLEIFADLAQRALDGGLDTTVQGSLNPVTGGFDLTLDGTSTDLVLGIPTLDPLLGGVTRLSGSIARDAEGIRADAFQLVSDAVSLQADGIYAAQGTDFGVNLTVDELGRISNDVTGEAQLDLRATGGIASLRIDATAAIPDGTLQSRPLNNARINISAEGASAAELAGTINGGARIGDLPVDLSGGFSVEDEVQRLKEFSLTAGDSGFQGTIARGADGLFAGTVNIDSPDIAGVAALAGADVSGEVAAQLILSRSVNRQRASLNGRLRELEVADTRLGAADVDLTVTDLLGVPLADGQISARDAVIGSFELEQFSARSETQDRRMNLTAEARLRNGTEADLAAALTNLNPGVEVALNQLTVITPSQDLRLPAPSRFTAINGALTLSPTVLDVGEGRLEVSGTSGDTLGLDLLMEVVPLGLVNDIVPGLNVAGTIDGSARISGTPDAPSADFDLRAQGVSAQAALDLGLPPADIALRGRSSESNLDVAAEVRAGTAVDLAAAGRVPLQPDAQGLDLAVELRRFSMLTVDQLVGDLGLTGVLEGTATIAGAISNPRAEFSLTGSDLGLRAARDSGLGTANATLQGSYADQEVVVSTLDMVGQTSLSLRASGRVPLAGPGLDIDADGQFPLALANTILAGQQAQAAGMLDVSVRASGALDAPQLAGSARLSDASFASQSLNLRLNNIDMAARLAGDTIVLDQASAALGAGGRLTLAGQVGITPQSGFPADLRVQLQEGVYSDGEIVTARLEADLALTGPLAGGAAVSGTVDLRRTEISIPKSFGLNEGVLLDVDHFAPPRDVVLTLDRAGLRDAPEAQTAAVPIGLDVLVRAPNQIFVRGRGLDAELGGQIQLRGTTTDVNPVGAINLIRGRLGILGQRIDLDEGAITLLGTLDPIIRLVAETTSRDGTLITITVEGSATDPEIVFSSSPELPQDEVLAQLIFDRSVSELSAFQIAQLAAAANTLAGGGDGIGEQFRSAVGLANLDVTSGDEGEVGVRAGAYIDDNIYLDVEADSAGGSKATINLDITQDFRARASVDNEGDSTIGLFFERDY